MENIAIVFFLPSPPPPLPIAGNWALCSDGIGSPVARTKRYKYRRCKSDYTSIQWTAPDKVCYLFSIPAARFICTPNSSLLCLPLSGVPPVSGCAQFARAHKISKTKQCEWINTNASTNAGRKSKCNRRQPLIMQGARGHAVALSALKIFHRTEVFMAALCRFQLCWSYFCVFFFEGSFA